MFERMSPAAMAAFDLAQREADRLGHGYLGTEHLLAGLIAHGDNAAAAFLAGHGLDLAGARTALDRLVTQGRLPGPRPADAQTLSALGIDLAAIRESAEARFGPVAVDDATCRVARRHWWQRGRVGRTPLSGRPFLAKRAMERAVEAAGGRMIAPEHLLIGLLDDCAAPVREGLSRRSRREFGRLGLAEDARGGAGPLLAAADLDPVALHTALHASLGDDPSG
ncbi:MAG: Clp protease [Pseudonocardiales bacterium]|nr:MAG: Clp protease [Pseudonocardiales bacterium]